MLPHRVSNPGPLTYESGALPIALRGPAEVLHAWYGNKHAWYGNKYAGPPKLKKSAGIGYKTTLGYRIISPGFYNYFCMKNNMI